MQCIVCQIPMEKQDHPPGTLPQWRCQKCGRLHTLSETNVLILADPAAAPVKTKAPNNETSTPKKETPPVSKRLLKRALTTEDKAIVARRLASGDKPKEIAADISCDVKLIYNYKQWNKKAIEEARSGSSADTAAPPIVILEKPQPVSAKRPAQTYNNMKGNIMSQMGRLNRGEIKTRAARPVISRYKEMLESEVKVKLGEVRELKHKISAADDALNALDIIEKGEKDIIEKVLASVR